MIRGGFHVYILCKSFRESHTVDEEATTKKSRLKGCRLNPEAPGRCRHAHRALRKNICDGDWLPGKCREMNVMSENDVLTCFMLEK